MGDQDSQQSNEPVRFEPPTEAAVTSFETISKSGDKSDQETR